MDRNLMLVAVIAPFFTSFLIRTLSWKLLLGDNSFLVDALNALPFVDGVRLLATPFAVITGLTYNFLPFMVLPLYASLEKVDPRLIEAGQRPLRLAVHRPSGWSRCRWRCPAWSPARC